MSPCNFWLFGRINKPLRGIQIHSLDALEAAVTAQIGLIPAAEYRHKMLTSWLMHWSHCVNTNGNYFEGAYNNDVLRVHALLTNSLCCVIMSTMGSLPCTKESRLNALCNLPVPNLISTCSAPQLWKPPRIALRPVRLCDLTRAAFCFCSTLTCLSVLYICSMHSTC